MKQTELWTKACFKQLEHQKFCFYLFVCFIVVFCPTFMICLKFLSQIKFHKFKYLWVLFVSDGAQDEFTDWGFVIGNEGVVAVSSGEQIHSVCILTLTKGHEVWVRTVSFWNELPP